MARRCIKLLLQTELYVGGMYVCCCKIRKGVNSLAHCLHTLKLCQNLPGHKLLSSNKACRWIIHLSKPLNPTRSQLPPFLWDLVKLKISLGFEGIKNYNCKKKVYNQHFVIVLWTWRVEYQFYKVNSFSPNCISDIHIFIPLRSSNMDCRHEV